MKSNCDSWDMSPMETPKEYMDDCPIVIRNGVPVAIHIHNKKIKPNWKLKRKLKKVKVLQKPNAIPEVYKETHNRLLKDIEGVTYKGKARHKR